MAIVLDGTSGITTPNIVANAGNIASPVFTGNPVAPTPSSGDKDTTLATTAYANSLLAEYEVTGSAVTSIDFSGLDINTHKSYRIEFEWKNPTANYSSIQMFVNGDATSTNYYTQELYIYGTAMGAQRKNGSEIIYCEQYSTALGNANISLLAGESVGCLSHFSYSIPSTVQENYRTIRKTNTVTNITQLTFTASIANSIGIGSKIRIYRGDV